MKTEISCSFFHPHIQVELMTHLYRHRHPRFRCPFFTDGSQY